jgi:hypothetical protein
MLASGSVDLALPKGVGNDKESRRFHVFCVHFSGLLALSANEVPEADRAFG